MKRNGKYRFSLQFPALTEQQIKVGDALERMGNRKSSVIVKALLEYLDNHPAFLSDIQPKTKKGKAHSSSTLPARHVCTPSKKQQDSLGFTSSDETISSMLDNLSLFV